MKYTIEIDEDTNETLQVISKYRKQSIEDILVQDARNLAEGFLNEIKSCNLI